MNSNVASIVVQYADCRQLIPLFRTFNLDYSMRINFWMNEFVRGEYAKYVFGFFPNIVFCNVSIALTVPFDAEVWADVLIRKVVWRLVINCKMYLCFEDGYDNIVEVMSVIFNGVHSGYIKKLVLLSVSINNLDFLRVMTNLKSLELNGCRSCINYDAMVYMKKLRVLKIWEHTYWWRTKCYFLCVLEKCVGLKKLYVWDGFGYMPMLNLPASGLKYICLRNGFKVDAGVDYGKIKVIKCYRLCPKQLMDFLKVGRVRKIVVCDLVNADELMRMKDVYFECLTIKNTSGLDWSIVNKLCVNRVNVVGCAVVGSNKLCTGMKKVIVDGVVVYDGLK